MELILLGTGPANPVIGEGKDNRRNSSMLLLTRNGTTVLFDCTPQFYEQMQTFAPDVKKIDYIIFSHGHSDAIGGIPQLKYWLNEKKQANKPTVFAEKETEFRIKEHFKDISHLEIKNFNPYEILDLKYLKIVPFRVIHAEAFPTGDKYPCVGFRIDNKIVYAEDMEKAPEKSIPYFDNSRLIIIDAAMWIGRKIRGHMNVETALNFCKKFKTKEIVLTQAGHTYPPYKQAYKEILKLWDEIGNKRVAVKLAYDGMKIVISDNFEKVNDYLIQIKEGIYLPDPHAELIWKGKKKYIVKAKKYMKMIDRLLYVCDDKNAYGIIRLKKPFMINLKEFNNFKSQHLVSNEERKKWWGNKRYLFMYPFDIIEKFKKPRKIKVERGTQTFIKNVRFLEELSVIELIEDITEYNPENINNAQLADDWRIVCAWYATKKRGESLKHSMDTIISLARKIYEEIVKRVKRGDMKHTFKPESMSPFSKELYNKVSKNLSENDAKNNEYTAKVEELMPLLNQFKDFKIIKDFISLVGSNVKREIGHTPNDIDLHVRLRTPPDYIRRAIEVRLLKMLPAGIREKIHFIWGDPEGSHDSFVPLYDLKLVRVNPEIVEMNEYDVGSEIIIDGKKAIIKEIRW